MRRCAFLIVSALLLMCGCAEDKPRFTEEELAQIPLPQKEGLPAPSGGFVLTVSGETVTSDEIVEPLMEHLRPIAQRNNFEQFKAQARASVEQVLIARVSNILLYKQAKKQAGEQVEDALEKAAEAEVRKFVISFGGDYAKAEEALKERAMDWRSFKKYQKRMILSQSYLASKMPAGKPITYSDLMEYYNSKKEQLYSTPAVLKFRLIDIEAGKLEVAEPNRSQLEQARELAYGLAARIRTGEDFGELAKTYSHGYRASFGGLWKRLEPDSLAEPYDILATEAEKMEPGQIAGPIETDEHIFIMKLEEKRQRSVEPFEKVQKEIEAEIRLDRRKEAVDEFGAKLVEQAAIGDKDKFIDFCLEKIYQISNQ